MIDADGVEKALQNLQKLTVPYSNFAYHKNNTAEQAKHVFELYKKTGRQDRAQFMERNNLARFNVDGFGGDINVGNANAYLYSAVFRTNIVWISEEHTLFFSENVADEPKKIKDIIEFPFNNSVEDVMIALKIALNTQGVVPIGISELREGTFKAVDLIFKNEKYKSFVVNAPIPDAVNCDEEDSGEGIRFIDMTPFRLLRSESGQLTLYYYDVFVDEVDVYPPDVVATSGKYVEDCGLPYNYVAYLSSDRLRVHVTNKCKFKKTKEGCKFCNISMRDPEFIPDNAIKEVVSAYLENYRPNGHAQIVNGHEALRHYLIGGQSADVNETEAANRLESVVKILRSLDANANIYAMILPCNAALLKRLLMAGLNEIAFNIEIFDDKLAKKYMPGKGSIPREEYLTSLKIAVAYFNAFGRGLGDVVRSMLLIGLEPFDNTLECVKELVKIGVQPMLSVFRPLPETPLANLVSPPMERVLELYKKAQKICGEAGISLGPKCDYCKNNTISLPLAVTKK